MSRTEQALGRIDRDRSRLLEGIPVEELRLDAAGIPTTVLAGGSGPPVVLLHGPGESAVNWRWTIPGLTATHRVLAPDLPGHGSSGSGQSPLDADRAVQWLRDLIAQTCAERPALVGHVLGGSIAARFAARHRSELQSLVLVDSLGLARFRPTARFALAFLGFAARPNERRFERFMNQCAYDLDHLQRRLGRDWTSFVAYNLRLARSEGSKQAGRLFRRAGLPRIPSEELAGIGVPTTLIWGRYDRANRVSVAKKVSERYDWPLHVIDKAADDPARDQPEAFLQELLAALDRPQMKRGPTG